MTGNDPNYQGTFGSKGGGEVITVPDQSITIAELFRRHTRNQPIPEEIARVRTPEYLGDQIVPTFTDMTDRDEYVRELKRKKRDVEQDIAKAKKEAAEKRKNEEAIQKAESGEKTQEKSSNDAPGDSNTQ